MPQNFAPRAAVIVHAPQVVAVGHRRERAVERQHFEAVAGRSRSRMICGRSSETTYEQTEMWKPGNTSSVTAAPPSDVPALEHEHAAAGAGQICRVRRGRCGRRR